MKKPELAFNHLDKTGRAHMVDVSPKPVTRRLARAAGFVAMATETLSAITKGIVAKGDVLTIARLAGIMGAKETARLIPLCHPLFLSNIDLALRLNHERCGIEIMAVCICDAPTGVEMEALTAVSVCALTLVDMCKSADRNMVITDIRLIEKKGGRSGHFVSSEAQDMYSELSASLQDRNQDGPVPE